MKRYVAMVAFCVFSISGSILMLHRTPPIENITNLVPYQMSVLGTVLLFGFGCGALARAKEVSDQRDIYRAMYMKLHDAWKELLKGEEPPC